MTHRIHRINGMIRSEISKIILEDLKDPRLAGLISITSVNTSPDLENSKVYVSVMGDKLQQKMAIEGFESASGFLRKELKSRVTWKRIPNLEFHLDDSIEKAAHIAELLQKPPDKDIHKGK